LRKLLSANIKIHRKRLGISQEKLAEITGLSIQTINGIEGCRTWVSDNTFTIIASALGVDAFQLLLPAPAGEEHCMTQAVSSQFLRDMWQSVKADIDAHFDRLLKPSP
jgi:transcriptional regulator with XRE-family HTH domain